MRWRRWTTGLLVVALVVLSPVAHASPLDPTWIAGFWDDDDDAIFLVTSMASVVDMNLVFARVPVPVVASVATLKPESFSARTLSPTGSRAPPVPA